MTMSLLGGTDQKLNDSDSGTTHPVMGSILLASVNKEGVTKGITGGMAVLE